MNFFAGGLIEALSSSEGPRLPDVEPLTLLDNTALLDVEDFLDAGGLLGAGGLVGADASDGLGPPTVEVGEAFLAFLGGGRLLGLARIRLPVAGVFLEEGGISDSELDSSMITLRFLVTGTLPVVLADGAWSSESSSPTLPFLSTYKNIINPVALTDGYRVVGRA